MFGFLKPLQPTREWRQSYARICQFQRRMFGLSSLPFLSYEAAFLYQAAVDFGFSQSLPEDAVTCCRLRRMSRDRQQPDHELASFAAAFGLVLAGVKLRDDVADSGRWINRLLWWKYQRQVANAEHSLESQSPGLMQTLRDCIRAHSALETSGSSVTLDQFTEQTGNGFAAVFRAAALRCSTDKSDDCVDALTRIGRHIGRAIIAWDCAVDFHHDQVRGQFNPLQSPESIPHAMSMCRLELSQAGWLCPENCAATTVVQSVIRRIEPRSRRGSAVCDPVLLERWGLLRQRGYSYARCDGCEVLCAAGECLQCLGGNANCFECLICWPHQSCVPCGAANSASSRKTIAVQDSGQPAQYERLHGRDGETDGALTPVGYVTIGGEKIPARSVSGDYIEAGTAVRVVRTDPIGVSVIPIE